MASLFHQIKSSITAGFGDSDNGGVSKKSIKNENFFATKDHVFSYSERERLIATASQFAKWIKENHPEIKQVKQLNKEIAKEFLLLKHVSNGGTCNSNSVNTLEQSLDKIAHLCNKKFNLNHKISMEVSHKELPQDGEKKRSLRMEKGIYQQALDTLRDGSESKSCLELARTTAMRASEFEKLQARDIDFKYMKIHIHDSKGGRSRDIKMSGEAADILKKIINDRGLKGEQFLFTIKAESIDKSLTRALKRIGHEEFIDAKTSLHSVRKMVAQEMYRNKIKSRLERGIPFEKAEKMAMGDTSKYLGHGYSRTITNYIDRYDSIEALEADGF